MEALKKTVFKSEQVRKEAIARSERDLGFV